MKRRHYCATMDNPLLTTKSHILFLFPHTSQVLSFFFIFFFFNKMKSQSYTHTYARVMRERDELIDFPFESEERRRKKDCGDFGKAHIHQQKKYYKRFGSNEKMFLCVVTQRDYRDRAYWRHMCDVCVCIANRVFYSRLSCTHIELYYVVIILMCSKSSNKILSEMSINYYFDDWWRHLQFYIFICNFKQRASQLGMENNRKTFFGHGLETVD